VFGSALVSRTPEATKTELKSILEAIAVILHARRSARFRGQTSNILTSPLASSEAIAFSKRGSCESDPRSIGAGLQRRNIRRG